MEEVEVKCRNCLYWRAYGKSTIHTLDGEKRVGTCAWENKVAMSSAEYKCKDYKERSECKILTLGQGLVG